MNNFELYLEVKREIDAKVREYENEALEKIMSTKNPAKHERMVDPYTGLIFEKNDFQEKI